MPAPGSGRGWAIRDGPFGRTSPLQRAPFLQNASAQPQT